MNKSYKSVWNESTGSWVAVSELATGRSKSKRAKTAISKAILTQIAVGGMGLAGASIAMAGDPVKLGTGATVNVADGVAIGTDAEVDADFGANAGKTGGVAIGNQAFAAGSGVSIGQNSEAGSDSMAMGDSASATLGGTAIGQNARSFAAESVALGQNASATGKGSLALGANTNAQYSNSTAIGQGATTDRAESVSVGSATIKRQITNVAAGTQDTDATNVSQLKALGASFDTSGNVTNTFVSYDSSAKDLLTLKGASGTKITNLTAGAVSSASKDAVNGSQLFAVAQSAADAVGGSSTVGVDGKITKPVYTVSGNTYTSLDSALSGVASMVSSGGTGGTGGGTDPLAVHYDTAGKTSVSLGVAGSPVKISNVATGTSTTDAVNVGQLSTATNGLSDAVSAIKFIGISKSMTGDSAVATGTNAVAIGAFAFANADSALAFGTNSRATGKNSVAIGAGSYANQANTVSIGATNTERRLTNMAAGVNDTDGVNLGQMKDYVDTSMNSVASTNVQSKGLLKSAVRSNGLLGATSTAFTLPDVMAIGVTDKQGQTEALGADSIAMGLNTHSNGESAVAVGSNTTSAGLASVGVGYGVIVNGAAAAAFGNSASVVSDGGLAMGNNAAVQTNSVNGIAIGTQSESAATEAIAIGQSAKAYGVDSIVLGNTAKATGVNSILIGTGSTSTTSATGSVVIGNGNTVTGANTVVLGSNMVGTGASKKTVSGTNSVVLGDGSDGSLSNVVSIGAAGKERKIVNVAAGSTTTDAVNFGQMNTAIASAVTSGGGDSVAYDTTAHASVTFGGTGAAVALKNVAAGVTTTDAVNMGQLTAMGILVDSTGKAQNAFVAYDDTSMNTITLKGAAGTTKITKLTAGALTATSTDAVNGSQLFNTASSAADAIGGGSTLDPATGKISKPAISVGGTTYTDVAAAVTAAGTAATTAGTAAAAAVTAAGNAVQYDQVGHTSVTLGGTGAAVKLSNVANGTSTNDAVNFGQLTQLGGLVDSTGKALNAFVAYDNNTSKDTITLKGTAGTKITKLTAGALTAASTDAVNGSQLFTTASSAADAIGGGSTLDPATGKISKPSIKVGTTTFDNLSGAVVAAAALATTGSTEGVMYDTTAHASVTFGGTGAAVALKNVAAGVTATDAVNFGQLTQLGGLVDSTGKALNAFVAYDNNTSKDTITLKGTAGTKITKLTAGALTAASTDAVNGSQLFTTASSAADAIGGGSTLDPATGKISKPAISVGGTTYTDVAAAVTAAGTAATTAGTAAAAAVTAAGNAVQYDQVGHTSVTLGGTGAAVKLSNVANGTSTNDAVNFGQLTQLGGLVDSTGKALNAFVAYDNNTSKDTITLKGTAGTKITKLTSGAVNATSTDAINGSQLYNTALSAAAVIGGDSTVDANGKITKPSFTVGTSTYDTIGAAITAAGANSSPDGVMYDSSAHDHVTFGGTGAAVVLSNVAQGVKATDAVNMGQLTALGMQVDSNGKALNAFVSYDSAAKGSVTLNAGGAAVKVTNVATGVADTDAVNVAQLNTAVEGNTQLANNLKYVKFGASSALTANATGTDSTALGGNSFASGKASLALGLNARSTAANSVAIGSGSLANVANTVSVGTASSQRRIVNVGDATDDYDAVNLHQVTDMIDASTAAANAVKSTQMVKGVSRQMVGASGTALDWSDVIAVGPSNKQKDIQALGDDAIAVGISTHANGEQSVAVGSNVTTAGDGSVGVGSGVITNGVEATAVGVNASVIADHALAVGYNTAAESENAIAIGSFASVSVPSVGTSANGIAIGTNALVSGDSSIAIGMKSSVSGANTVVLGNNVKLAKGSNSVVLGNGSDGSQDNVISVGAAGKERKIINVADGASTKDAVNLGQMTAAIKAAGTGGSGGETFVTQEAAGSDLLVGSATDGTHVNFGGKGVASRELINVSAGTTDTSAVNVGQLKPVVAALGGGASFAGGQFTAPTYSIGGKDKHTVGDAFTAVDTNLTTLNTSVAAITAGGTGLVVQDPVSGDINVGALLSGEKVNFAGTAGDRVLTGVANGAITGSSSDAVNGKQIAGISSSFATAIGGGSQMNTDGSVTIPSFSVGGDTVHNVGDAISNIDSRVTNNYADLSSKITNITNSGGVATPNAVAYDSAAKDTLTLGTTDQKTKLTNLQDGNVAAGSTDAVTGGQLYATNQDVAALQSSVQNIAATGSTSIGVNGANGADGKPGAAGAAGATGADAIAMGDTASASGDHSVVIGGGATASGDGTTVIGGNGSATGANSTAIGSGSNATGANSVALGAGSVADRDNSVSVGSEGHERQITNVAAGTQGTDAVNLNQMNSAVGGIARKAYSGIAAATALTMIPDVDANKTLSIGIGGGTFQGYAATAIGGTARITQNIKVRVGAGWSAAGTTVGAGASYQW